MAENRWIIVCPESRAPGLWQTWFQERCVAIGWGPPKYTLEGKTESAGWDTARSWALEIKVGDIVIPYLKSFRFGASGRVTKLAISDSEWAPTEPSKGDSRGGELGRRIHVQWDNAPPPGKIALVPAKDQKGALTRHTIEPLKEERYQRLMTWITNPATWTAYGIGHVEESHSDAEEESIPSSESPSKLSVKEADIRRILARNLDSIEKGLRPLQHPDFSRFEEVPFDLGRLDLLCQDARGAIVIVELQLGWLDDSHIGKNCRYLGWFRRKYGSGVRLIHMFEDAAPDVVEAYKEVLPSMELKRFDLTASIDVSPL